VVEVAVWAKAGDAAIMSAVRTEICRIMDEGSLFFAASVARRGFASTFRGQDLTDFDGEILTVKSFARRAEASQG